MKVSVIIPVWNQEILLKRAVESLPLNEDIEVLIIDDGSTDNSYKTAKELEKQYNNIHVYHFEENRGVSAARNTGLDNAKGEYIFMLDSDDYVYTDEFIKALSFLDGTDMIYFNIQRNNGKLWVHNPNKPLTLPGQTKFWKRSFIGDTRYLEHMKWKEDWDFNYRLIEKHPTRVYTNLVVTHYNFPREGSLFWKGKRGLL